jgi:hypothetical protein
MAATSLIGVAPPQSLEILSPKQVIKFFHRLISK